MRILYISDRGKGGIKNHVKCLLASLKGVDGVETYCIGEDESFPRKRGHDFTEWKNDFYDKIAQSLFSISCSNRIGSNCKNKYGFTDWLM